MPAGRPTDYRPEYGEEIIGYLRDGYSITAAAGKMGFGRRTIYQWEEKHPEFARALNIARASAAAWWEDRLQAIAKGEEGNATAAIFGLKNRASEEWRDKTETEHSGKVETSGAVERLADLLARLGSSQPG